MRRIILFSTPGLILAAGAGVLLRTPSLPYPSLKGAPLLRQQGQTRWYSLPIQEERTLYGEIQRRGGEYLGTADSDVGDDYFKDGRWIIDMRAGSDTPRAEIGIRYISWMSEQWARLSGRDPFSFDEIHPHEIGVQGRMASQDGEKAD